MIFLNKDIDQSILYFRIKHVSLLLILLLLSPFSTLGQKDLAEEKLAAFRAHHAKIIKEKTYLHFEISDNDIWFNAYVYDSRTYSPSPISASITIQLLGKKNELLARKIYKLKDGKANGVFKLTKEEIDKVFFLIGETDWQKNNSPSSFKFILKEGRESLDICEVVRFNFSFDREETTNGYKNILAVNSSHDLNERKLELINQEGKVISMATIKDSYALFDLNPELQQDSTKLRIEGCENEHSVVQVHEARLITNLKKLGSNNYLLNVINVGTTLPENRLIGIMQSRGKIFKRADIVLKNEKARLVFSKDELPDGVSQITFLKSDGEAIKSELLYLEKEENSRIKTERNKDVIEFSITSPQDYSDVQFMSVAIRRDYSNFIGVTGEQFDQLLSEVRQPEFITDLNNLELINKSLSTQKWNGKAWNDISVENNQTQDSLMSMELRKTYFENIVYDEVDGNVRQLEDVTVTAEREKIGGEIYPSKLVTGKGDATVEIVDNPFINDNDNVLDVLQSGVSGVRILGDINSIFSDIEPVRIDIRGVTVGSLRPEVNPHPLILLDGIMELDPADLAKIRVSEIGNIEIFKGPSASRFGTRGGRGVIALYSRNYSKKGFEEFAKKKAQSKVKTYAKPVSYKTSKQDPLTDLLYWNSNIDLGEQGSITIPLTDEMKELKRVFMRIEAIDRDGRTISEVIPINLEN